MANVEVRPMPAKYREIPERLRPQHPPIFDGDPSAEDIALARALFKELDPESQRWYGTVGIFAAA
jgi:hypothetical protein